MHTDRLAVAHDDGTHQQSMLSVISDEMVGIYKERCGRGPAKTRTHWAGPDVLVVTLEQTFTPAQRTLQRMGEHQRLRDLRLLFSTPQRPASSASRSSGSSGAR